MNMHPKQALAILITISIALVLAFYICVILPKPHSCDKIISDRIADNYSWGEKEKTIYFSKDKKMYRATINNCEFRAELIHKLNSSDELVLHCRNSSLAIISDKKDLYRKFNLKTKNPYQIKNTKNFSPTYCDAKYIVWREDIGEFSNTLRLTDIDGELVKTIQDDNLIFTLIPLNEKEFISYKNGTQGSGIYKGQNLILEASKFTQWDYVHDSLYYTQADYDKTPVKSISKKYKGQIQTINYPISQAINISPEANWLATKTLNGKLILFKLKK